MNSNTSHSSSSNAGVDFLELRSRSYKHFSSSNRVEDDSPTNGLSGRAFIDHEIGPQDTLNSIALQYSAQVAEIKRANALLTDQEIFGLKFIRVPVPPHSPYLAHNIVRPSSSGINSPFFHSNANNGLLTNKGIHANQMLYANTTNNASHRGQQFHNDKTYNRQNHKEMDPGRVPLLQDYSSDGNSNGDDSEVEFLTGDAIGGTSPLQKKKRKKTKRAIENLLEKADATVAAVRENLSERSPNLEHGRGFHFIDATAPDNTSKGIWLIVLSVVFMFVIVPLILTLMEEKSEEEELLLHTNAQRLQQLHPSHQGDLFV